MEITITLSEEDQSLQAEILRVLLTPKSDKSDKSDESDETPKATTQPTPKPYPLPTDPAPSDTSDTSDASDKTAHPSDTSDSSDTSDPSDTTPKSDETPKQAEQPTPEAPALSMAELRKSVNAISRKKGLNWLYSWLGDLGVKSITEIPTDRLEEAHSKLQNYA